MTTELNISAFKPSAHPASPLPNDYGLQLQRSVPEERQLLPDHPTQLLSTGTTLLADLEQNRQAVLGFRASPVPTSPWSERLGALGAGITAASGISSTLQALRQDQVYNDHSYRRTMTAILGNVAITSSSFATGSVVATTAASLLGGTVFIPATLGVAAGFGMATLVHFVAGRISQNQGA